MADDKKDKKSKKLFELGPMEQILILMGVMIFGKGAASKFFKGSSWSDGAASHPSDPYSLTPASLTTIPLFSPATMLLVFVAYFGYHLLKRQEGQRDQKKALAKAAAKAAKSSSSSSGGGSSSSRSAMTSKDVRAGGMPSSSSSSSASKTGHPGLKQVSKSSKTDPSSNAFQGNYFMTMQGPGRPALVPFQAGLRPKEGEEAGTMWWDNVPEGMPYLARPVELC